LIKTRTSRHGGGPFVSHFFWPSEGTLRLWRVCGSLIASILRVELGFTC